jgi:hypothetical protein
MTNTPPAPTPSGSTAPARHRVERSIIIDADPTAAWALVGDFANSHHWTGSPLRPEIIGDPTHPGAERHVSLDATLIVERLTSRNDAHRVLTYTLARSPFPISEHQASLIVEALPAGAGPAAGPDTGTRVTWLAEFTADAATAAQLDAVMGDENFEPGLQHLKSVLEASR